MQEPSHHGRSGTLARGRPSTHPRRRARAVAVLAVLAGLVLGPVIAAGAQVPTDSIEEYLDAELPASGVPGLAWAIVDDGEVVEVGTRGVRTIGGDRAVTPDTSFSAGSITKSFTALAVMQLVEAERVDLDAPVSTYLDDFADQPAGAITVRQLLRHTSGYSTLQGNATSSDGDRGRGELERRVANLARTTPATRPDERWQYSNANYLVLGRLVEVVSGQNYRRRITARILRPLGMDRSMVANNVESFEDTATGHRPWFGTKRPWLARPPLPFTSEPRSVRPAGMAPAGGLVASATDLARYLAAMMNDEDDVLSAVGKAQMVRPAGVLSPSYGFGWFVDTEHGVVSHTGLTPGFESLAAFVPAERRGVVVLLNANSGVGFGEVTPLLDGIAARALGLDDEGPGSRWPQKALFASLVVLPVVYLLSIAWAWRHREALRAKSGAFGLFSLWFPVLTTAAAAGAILWFVPTMLGAPLRTLALYQPDLALVMVASAVLGVLWAVVRLAVGITNRPNG